jgi:phosphate starvation-inducible PhoH-like protein
LFGERHSHLHFLEKALKISIYARGNHLAIAGEEDSVSSARQTLDQLYKRLEKGGAVEESDVRDALAIAEDKRYGTNTEQRKNGEDGKPLTKGSSKRTVQPRSAMQATYLDALSSHEMVFGLGPAGTGKTYLAVAKAVEYLTSGQVERLILARPAVEAGERLGFLPGDMKEKVDPYLRPLYDALNDLLPTGQLAKKMETGEIEIAPLAFMRGRTLGHAFVLVDEAQNTTPMQMKMLLTRLGEGSRMVITGDLTQVDLPHGHPSGLAQALNILQNVQEIAFIQFSEKDVVRHPLVARIVRAYQDADR